MWPEEWLRVWIQNDIAKEKNGEARAQYIYHQKFIDEKSSVKSMYF